MIVEIIYSLQFPLTTLWQTCYYEYIASNMATVQIRKLSFILSYVVMLDVVGNIQNDRMTINYKINDIPQYILLVKLIILVS